MPQFPRNLKKSARNRKKNVYNELLLGEYSDDEKMETQMDEFGDKGGEPLSVVVVEIPHNPTNYFSNSVNEHGFISNPHTSEDVMANEANFDASGAHVPFFYPTNDNRNKKKKLRGPYDNFNETTDEEDENKITQRFGVQKAEVIDFYLKMFIACR